MKSRVILLAGAGGAGKSTIAELISRQHGYELLDGDYEDSEYFPYGRQWFPQNLNLLKSTYIFYKYEKLCYLVLIMNY